MQWKKKPEKIQPSTAFKPVTFAAGTIAKIMVRIPLFSLETKSFEREKYKAKKIVVFYDSFCAYSCELSV